MMKSTQNMFWSEINGITRFTENTEENKAKQARKTSAIILAAVQVMENFIKGIKNMSAYDASSTILSDANWIQKSSFSTFMDKNKNEVTIGVGRTYYIDYGKTFYGELAYFHHGLCIGKREGKILIVPIRTGKDVFPFSYHPTNNPYANRKHRQGLKKEGFVKDCVLIINDVKYISAGRIEKEGVLIDKDVLVDIQKQVFQVEFPYLYQEYETDKNTIIKNVKQIQDQKELISQLKSDNNHMKQLLNKS